MAHPIPPVVVRQVQPMSQPTFKETPVRWVQEQQLRAEIAAPLTALRDTYLHAANTSTNEVLEATNRLTAVALSIALTIVQGAHTK